MSTQNTPPAVEAVLEESGVEWDLFWVQHKSKILLGAIAAVVLAGGTIAWYVSSTLSARAAEAGLATAGDLASLEAVVKDYPGSTPAADALFLIAGRQHDDGKFDESTATFNKFLTSYPDHPLAGGALLGIGQNQDASGKSKEAQATYEQVMSRFPKSYAAAFAGYCEAEIYLRNFQKDEARRVLESLLVQFPDSHVAGLANAQLARIGAKPVAGVVTPQ